MYKYEITEKIEQFAPLETQEDWDCSGWAVNVENYNEINKLMLCLTVTDDVIKQAKEQNCDMIISHHPLFHIDCHSELVSESYTPQINVYCAHTNVDKAKGGTTDTLIDTIKNTSLFFGSVEDSTLTSFALNDNRAKESVCSVNDFLRILSFNNPLSVTDFSKIIKQISPNARIINNNHTTKLKKIAFCAGSGSEFIQDAKVLGADCLVTGDLKFHTALESPIVIYDIGHFESEILILPVFEKIIGNNVKIVYADEHSPFELI